MHELGVLLQAVRTVDRMARSRQIDCVSFMTLSVGRESDYVPAFFEKLFPVAVEQFPTMKNAELRIEMATGRGLQIKEFGYESPGGPFDGRNKKAGQ